MRGAGRLPPRRRCARCAGRPRPGRTSLARRTRSSCRTSGSCRSSTRIRRRSTGRAACVDAARDVLTRGSHALRDAPPAGGRAAAHRPRPPRPRLALAAGGDPAQGAAHAVHPARPARPPPRVPLQPVDRAAVRVPGGGRPGAAGAHRGRRSAAGASSRSAACGWSPTATCRRASRSSASCSTASATSRSASARRTRCAGCPTASASRPGCRSCWPARASRHFLTIKLSWSETNRFPYDLFWWEGLDGTRVLAHMFDNPDNGYNGVVGPRSALGTWRNARRPAHAESLLSVGYGDGGGGPTEEMLQRAREHGRVPGAAAPALRPGGRVLPPRRARRANCRCGPASSTWSSTAAR